MYTDHNANSIYCRYIERGYFKSSSKKSVIISAPSSRDGFPGLKQKSEPMISTNVAGAPAALVYLLELASRDHMGAFTPLVPRWRTPRTVLSLSGNDFRVAPMSIGRVVLTLIIIAAKDLCMRVGCRGELALQCLNRDVLHLEGFSTHLPRRLTPPPGD